MREKLVCRCGYTHQTKSARSGGRKSFLIQGATPHYAPDLPFRTEHVCLDVALDPKIKRVAGTVTHKLKVVSPGQKAIVLDQIGLQIEEAKINGENAKFEVIGEKLRILLRSEPAPGDTLELSVKYKVENPRRGLYFTGPDEAYPAKPYQVWSQGQDEDNHYWFPAFDYPNMKATSEIIATVPKGYTAVANGALLSKTEVGAQTKFHYKLGTPHVTYLITLAVAEFTEWADQGPRGLPIQYFVAPGREEDGKRAFSNTPKMIEAFERRVGVPYAYEKYSQIAVQDFIFGGMENTSATTQTDLTLHDAKAHVDFSSDPLVAHELAHQWFGDLLTCRDWSHGWLNEGFATFMERVWVEEDKSQHGGLEEAKYYQYADLKEYLADDGCSYRRPIVCNTYIEPIDLFDTHLYQKGGLVLNLIRHVLGEDQFWKSINLYVSRHRGGSVETLDLIRAIEDATGRNLRRFFDEWIFGAGYPDFALSYTWHDDKKLAELVIEQKQTGGKPFVEEHGAKTHLFHLPVVIELTLEGGKKISHRIEIGEARERVFLPSDSKPIMVRFDPGHHIPKTMKFPRPKEMLLHQLANDTDSMGRVEAAKELVKLADMDVVAALGKCALSDVFWGVQAEAAQALGEIRLDSARDALIRAAATPNAKARRMIVKALGTYKDAKSAEALKKFAERDESYFVEAEAISAWARTMLPRVPVPAVARIAETEEFLLSCLKRPSYREVVRGFTLRSLANLPGIGRGERPKAMTAILDWTRRGHEIDARMVAIEALGIVAPTAVPSEKARVFEAFTHLADEDNFRIRFKLVMALEASGAPEAVPLLQKIRALDSDGRIKRDAYTIIESLSSESVPAAVGELRTSFEKLEEENRKLRGMVEELQSAFKAGKAN